MSLDSYEIKQRVKEATDIVDLVGSYLQLRREGHGYKALCPWHDDTRPSLQVNPERQSFKCWVCDIGGDAFSFVMQMEGVNFREALQMLADRAGIALQPARGRADGEQPSPADDKRLQYQTMQWAVEKLHHCLLHDPQAEPARTYLRERGISVESIAGFRLGFAPADWDWMSNQARGTPHSPALLERVGLIGRRRNGPGYYDRFMGRVIFPIFDVQGRAIALGGRVLPGLAPADAAKYVNSPETPLFSKSNQLYGLNLARDAIRKSGTALVMEGYTDCIMAHQHGFASAVAVLGTALGPPHIKLLNRMAERLKIVLVLDGDEAGRRRASEVLELFVAENVDLRVLTLPDDLDPCELLLARGAEALTELVAGASDALTHARRVATAGIDLANDLHAANRALEKLLSTIAKAPRLRYDTTTEDRLRVEMFLRRLATEFAVPEEQLRRRMTELRRASAARPFAGAATAAVATMSIDLTSADACELELLEILVQAPHLLSGVDAPLAAQLQFEPGRRIASRVRHLLESGQSVDFQRLLLEFDDPAVKNLLVELDERGRRKTPCDWPALWRHVVAAFERRRQHQHLRARAAELKTRQLGQQEEDARLSELLTQHRIRQGISAPKDG